MADVNKVEIGGKTLIDLTSDTVAADKMQKGITAHSASGETVEGILEKVQHMTQEEFDAMIKSGTYDPDGYYSTPDDEQTTTATADKVGVMKLYESLGDANDGTMTQAAIKAAIEAGGGGGTEVLFYGVADSPTINNINRYNYLIIYIRNDSGDYNSGAFATTTTPESVTFRVQGHSGSSNSRIANLGIVKGDDGILSINTSNLGTSIVCVMGVK